MSVRRITRSVVALASVTCWTSNGPALASTAEAPRSVEAQPAAKPVSPTVVVPQDAVIRRALELLQAGAVPDQVPPRAATDDWVSAEIDRVPSFGPPIKQVAASSTAPGSASLVDGPSFPELIGLAIDNDFVNFDDSALTLNLNVFGFRALANPNVIDRQQLYGSSFNTHLRRFGGAVTVGGKGEAFDRDGDGEADAALSAERPGDIVHLEARYRLWGSRDRRDLQNFARYVTAVQDAFDTLNSQASSFVERHLTEIKALGTPSAADLQIPAAAMTKFLSTPAIEAEVIQIAALLRDFVSRHEATTKEIDRSAVVTVIAGGTRQKDQFGPNRLKFGIHAVAPTGPADHSLNLDWLQVHADSAGSDPTTLRLGYELSGLLLRATSLTQDGVKVSGALSAEHFRNVPTAKHDTVLKGNIKLELPVAKGITLPLSVTYANHRDLLSDESNVVGHFALAFDLSELTKKK